MRRRFNPCSRATATLQTSVSCFDIRTPFLNGFCSKRVSQALPFCRTLPVCFHNPLMTDNINTDSLHVDRNRCPGRASIKERQSEYTAGETKCSWIASFAASDDPSLVRCWPNNRCSSSAARLYLPSTIPTASANTLFTCIFSTSHKVARLSSLAGCNVFPASRPPISPTAATATTTTTTASTQSWTVSGPSNDTKSGKFQCRARHNDASLHGGDCGSQRAFTSRLSQQPS